MLRSTDRFHPSAACTPTAHRLRRRAALLVATAVAAVSLVPPAWSATDTPAAGGAAPAWPTKPLSLVIPFPPGGSADTIGRLMGKRLSDALGQPVVIDNRPGAGTAIAAGYVAKAAPDGYTLFLSSGSTFTANPAIRSKLPYDSLGSFDPVAIVGRIPLILLANKDVPINDAKAFAAAVKARPDQYTYASFGTVTTSHFTAEIVLQAIGAKLTHVPYKGSAPAMTDLIGGQVPFSFDTVTAAIPQVKSGKVKAIAVTSARRSSQLPDVPTFAESGYADIDVDTWIMMVVPKGTPESIRGHLEKTLAEIVADQDTRSALAAIGAEPTFSDGKAGRALIERELPVMRAVARSANIQAD